MFLLNKLVQRTVVIFPTTSCALPYLIPTSVHAHFLSIFLACLLLPLNWLEYSEYTSPLCNYLIFLMSKIKMYTVNEI